MSDQPSTITQPLLLELIKTLSENTEELHKLRSEVEQLAREKRALIRDVACMSRGVEQFRADFEPYLKNAIAAEKVWRDRRSNWVTMIVGAALLSLCAWVGYAVLNYASEHIAAIIARKGPPS
jgi:hypothetical protein